MSRRKKIFGELLATSEDGEQLMLYGHLNKEELIISLNDEFGPGDTTKIKFQHWFGRWNVRSKNGYAPGEWLDTFEEPSRGAMPITIVLTAWVTQ